MTRCEECGSWEAECMADEPVEGCGCARCANATLRKVSAERDSLKTQLELAEAFHNVAVKERDFYNIRLVAHERVVEAVREFRRWDAILALTVGEGQDAQDAQDDLRAIDAALAALDGGELPR